MKLLALDSSGLVASVAVLNEDTVLAEYTVNHKKTHSQTLLPMIDEIMRMLDMDIKEIDAIALSGGPGSFTGLRIGSATAKGLGMALDRPLIAVPTVDALACNLSEVTDSLIVPMMDARREQVYTGIYKFDSGRLQVLHEQWPAAVTELAEILNERGEQAVLLGDGVPVYKNLLDELLKIPFRTAPSHLNRQRAGAVGFLALQYLAEGKTVTAAEHVPEYLRLSQAERERREREQQSCRIRRMTEDDLKQIMVIEEENFSVPWSEKSFREMLLRPEAVFLVAERPSEDTGEKKILGYAGAVMAMDSGDITNIAVLGHYKQKGIASVLLDHLIHETIAAGVKNLFLEVREHNIPALRLYQKAGFVESGRRRGYYDKPKEDALIMVRKSS